MQAESNLMGAHFYFQDVGTGEKIQLSGEDNEENFSVNRHFSLQMEEVVGQESPLEENNLEKLHTCLLGEEGEKEGLFSLTGPLCPLETTDL